MNMFDDASLAQIDALIRALGMGLLHSLWQCALIGALAWLALRALRHASPQARYVVACAALAACVLWPATEVFRQWSMATAPTFDMATTVSSPRDIASMFAAFVAPDRPADVRSMVEAALPWLVATWAAGACLMLLRLAGGLRWVHRLQRDALDVEGDVEHRAWQTRLDRLAQRFGLSGVRFAVFDDTGGPLSTGFWRPMVLVPASLLARMPVDMLEALLAHELAHIRRRDFLANLLQRAAEALLFHHPVAWWLSQRIRHEREQAADMLAASVIGEPRRLALALYELDRISSEQTHSPIPTLAQAAHGGHLMSRIQSLLRTERRVSPGAAAIPVIGLTAACIACFAYAQSTQTAAPAPKVTVGTLAAAAVATNPKATEGSAHETYAFVSEDSDRLAMSGDSSDVDEIREARSQLGGDFLWFRRDGKAYVLRDAATVERMRALWAGNASREAQMKALGEQMRAESEKVQAISSRIEAVASLGGETPRMREAIGKMEALAERQNTSAHQQAELATTIATRAAGDKSDAGAEARMEALDAQMEALDRQMRALENVIDAEAEKLEASLAPLAAMEKEMEAAAAPMEALGAKMEKLGAEQEREMAVIDRQIRAEIDRAMSAGLATPAPSAD
jgi:beta-lactamase regulating signal transducer with metallopeptidase domain